MTFQSSTQAFNKAYEMLKDGIQCKLYRLDGVWYCIEKQVEIVVDKVI